MNSLKAGHSSAKALRTLAVKAMQTMTPAGMHQVREALLEVEALATANVETDDWKKQAAADFEKDMMPVRSAIISVLKAGDLEAWRGLQALLPHLLAEVSQSPTLSALLAHQLGAALLEGLTAGAEKEGGAQ